MSNIKFEQIGQEVFEQVLEDISNTILSNLDDNHQRFAFLYDNNDIKSNFYYRKMGVYYGSNDDLVDGKLPYRIIRTFNNYSSYPEALDFFLRNNFTYTGGVCKYDDVPREKIYLLEVWKKRDFLEKIGRLPQDNKDL